MPSGSDAVYLRKLAQEASKLKKERKKLQRKEHKVIKELNEGRRRWGLKGMSYK